MEKGTELQRVELGVFCLMKVEGGEKVKQSKGT